MESKLVIFDMDDVMWDLNKRVSEITGVPYEKFTCFSVHDNLSLTDRERQLILDAYTNHKTYEDIRFREPVIDLVNKVNNEYPEYALHIISNCGTQKIADTKKPQLLRVLDVPEYKIHLNVIDIPSGTKKKKLPDNIYIFVDDSPHNIMQADAVHKIMPARLHNDVLTHGKLKGRRVDRPENDVRLRMAVLHYIEKGR